MYIGRMSRWDWLALNAQKPRKAKPKREVKPKADLKKFTARVNGKNYTFSAYTKSEARAMLKKELGGVIPFGTLLEEKL
jgi:hypothetical protein